MTIRDAPVFVFDGHCVMCSSFARFLASRDTLAKLRLVAAQSDEGRDLCRRAGQDSDDPTTNLYVDRDGRLHVRSEAALLVLSHAGLPKTVLSALLALPPRLRDAAYDAVAVNRFRFMGRGETCVYDPRANAAART